MLDVPERSLFSTWRLYSRDANWLVEKILREQVGTVPAFFCSREQSIQVENANSARSLVKQIFSNVM